MTTAAAGSGWHLGHLVRKIRLDKGLSIEALARLARMSSGEVLAVEENQIGQVPSLYLERLKKIEAVLGVDFLRASPIGMSNEDRFLESGSLHPFVTEKKPIHQNSMEWTKDGRLLDVEEHAPQFAIVPSAALKKFVGKKIPTNVLRTFKETARTRVSGQAPTDARQASRLSIWGHYQRLLIAAAKDEPTPPLRYNASLIRHGETRVTREVTAIRLASGIYETRTHIVATDSKIDVPCCRQYPTCAECFLRSSAKLLSKATA